VKPRCFLCDEEEPSPRAFVYYKPGKICRACLSVLQWLQDGEPRSTGEDAGGDGVVVEGVGGGKAPIG